MADNTVTIGIETTGAKEAIRDLETVGGVITKNAEKQTATLESLGRGFKSVSRDIDAVTGNASAGFAKWASDIAGVAEALSGGGLMAAITGVSAAVGVAVGLYKQWQAESEEAAKKAKEAAKAADDAAKAHAQLVKEIAAGIREGQKQINMETVLQREAELQARRLVLLRKGEELIQAELAKVQAKGVDEFKAASIAKDKIIAEIAREQAAIALEAEKARDDKDKLLTQEKNRWEVEAYKEHNEKMTADEKKAHDERLKNTNNSFEELAQLHIAANKKAEADAKLHRERMASIMFDDDYDKDLPLPPGIGLRKEEIDAQKERDDMLRKAGEDADRASEKRADTLAKEAAELKKKQDAEEEANNALIAHTASTIAYESAAMFVQPAISGLTNKIGELRDVNRENFQDFFDFSKMTPELVAAQVQAIAVGIAQQALGKAAMSGADAVKETALAIGDFAYGNAAGGEAHLKSAALHASAAAAYGAIAGGAAGVAVGIGATRGATEEEKQRNNRQMDRADSTGSVSSGSTMGRGDGSGGGGFSVTVVNNAPLIVPPSDQNRAGRAVARAVSRANRDAFARREMGQR